MAANMPQGHGGAAADEVRQDGHQRGQQPDPEPEHQQQHVLHRHEDGQRPRGETGGAEQGQLAPPLQDVPPLHDGQPDGAQQEPQPAETLERGEIRVLHGGQAC